MDRPHVRWGLSLLVMGYIIVCHPIMFITSVIRAIKETRAILRQEKHG